MSILEALEKILVTSSNQSAPISRIGSRHYTSAISDGLRNGSSEAAKVMAKWRWKGK